MSCTLNLQLACMELCRVCRSFSSLHVKLCENAPGNYWKGSPESLWVAPEDAMNRQHAAEGGRESGGKAPSRVPLVLPFSVGCRLSSDVLHSNGTTELWTRLERLRLVLDSSNWNLSPVILPRRLKQLVMVSRKNKLLPAALVSSLSSGGSSWLLKLHVNGNFDVPVADVVWPACLIQLSFGERFNQLIGGQSGGGSDSGGWGGGVKWPASLQQLSFKCLSEEESFTKITWPASLERLVFFDRGFDGPMQGAAWPSSLRKLVLGNDFNHTITGVVWPASLQQLSFGSRFNQSIVRVVWPASLQQLSFGARFNQPITEVVWPATLKMLSLPKFYEHKIEGTTWPASLEELVVAEVSVCF